MIVRSVTVLGVETSCDETAAAVVRWDGRRFEVQSNCVASQATQHAVWGGVVPELATREHLRALPPVVQAALTEAGTGWHALDLVVATRGPGLAPALLMGHAFGKAAALTAGLPFLGVNHIEGHLVSPFLGADAPDLPDEPWTALVVSGGHTALVRVHDRLSVRLLGATRDDAAGEAFDKGAKLLGLGYPGGPALERAARTGDPRAYDFPQGLRDSGDLAFSFSGLKTALRYTIRDQWSGRAPEGQMLADVCASYQRAIVEVLVHKAARATERGGLLAVAGGVACNGALRQGLEAMARDRGVRLALAPGFACTDNAAMIGAIGALRWTFEGKASPWDEDIDPNLTFFRP